MTHDELLEKIKWDLKTGIDGGLKGSIKKDFQSALRAVVELHKPTKAEDLKNNPKESGICLACTPLSLNFYEAIRYPCPTIQAIEKKLG
jgi:hypothetical protein